MKIQKKIIAAAAVGTLISCGVPVFAQQGGTTTGGGTAGQSSLNRQDQNFVREAAQGGLAEVTLGRLATQKGTTDAVRSFGQRMIQDHTQANAALAQIATRKGLTVPTTLPRADQQTQQRLSGLSGTRFDQQYMQHQVQDHQKDVREFQQEASKGHNPDLRAYAQANLPILQGHLTLAQNIVAGRASSAMSGMSGSGMMTPNGGAGGTGSTRTGASGAGSTGAGRSGAPPSGVISNNGQSPAGSGGSTPGNGANGTGSPAGSGSGNGSAGGS